MTRCKHATPSPEGRFVICALGQYGGRPSPDVCTVCPKYDGPSRGLGDTAKKVISTVTFGTLPTCTPCEERRKLLNRLLPYGQRPNQ